MEAGGWRLGGRVGGQYVVGSKPTVCCAVLYAGVGILPGRNFFFLPGLDAGRVTRVLTYLVWSGFYDRTGVTGHGNGNGRCWCCSSAVMNLRGSRSTSICIGAFYPGMFQWCKAHFAGLGFCQLLIIQMDDLPTLDAIDALLVTHVQLEIEEISQDKHSSSYT